MHQFEDGADDILNLSSSSSSSASPSSRSDFKFQPGMNLASTPTSSRLSGFRDSRNSLKGNNINNNHIISERGAAGLTAAAAHSPVMTRFPSIEKRRSSNVFVSEPFSPIISTIDNIHIKKSSSLVCDDGSVKVIPDVTLQSPDHDSDSRDTPPPALPTSAPPQPQLQSPSFSIGSRALNFNLNANAITKLTNGLGRSSSGSGSCTNGDVNTNHALVSRHRHSHSSSSILGADENFEYFPDHVEPLLFHSASENTSLQYSRDASDLSVPDISGIGGSGLPFKRNTVLRTSLRKSPQHNAETMGHRRWGSFRNTSGTKRPVVPVTSSSALASQLYRSSSFHSSGRSSAGDGEEMYSDGSLEDEVIDLTQKVHHLEEKFTVLAENQSDVDDRYTRAKQENAEISTKLFIVEEQLRETEQRAQDKLREEQRRFKDTLNRVEREKQLQIENYGIRLKSLERDLELSKSESFRFKQQLEKEKNNHELQVDKLLETERELSALRDDNRNIMDQSRKEREILVLETSGSQQALLDLKKEVESLRRFQMKNSPHSTLNYRDSIDSGDPADVKARLIELEEENKGLKQQNKQLQDANDDLTAQLLNQGLEEGLHLLTLNNVGVENSLAAEFEAMSQEQSPIETKPGFGDIFGSDLSKVKIALKEQKEVNDQLRTYIDGILLNIVENYPQLLEVKNKSCISPKY